MERVVVIGGGIHGVTAAIAFAKKGHNVSLIERNSTILAGTSGATHNRAHLGYHYPRSIETTVECIEGLNDFKERYPDSLHYPKETYYFIEKHSSKTSADDYVKFCNEVNIPFTLQWPDSSILNKERIEDSFLVPEPNFNLFNLKDVLLDECDNLGIQFHFDSKVNSGQKGNEGVFEIEVISQGKSLTLHADIVINATYAYTNNVLKSFGITDGLTKYRLQRTEVVAVKVKSELPALTVMDGPFVTIQPNAGRNNEVLVYDVVNSVLSETEGYTIDNEPELASNWEKMIEHGLEFYPFMRELKFLQSLRGTRPIPCVESNDGRSTKIVSHKAMDGLYSIQEGKFISATLVADKLVTKVR